MRKCLFEVRLAQNVGCSALARLDHSLQGRLMLGLTVLAKCLMLTAVTCQLLDLAAVNVQFLAEGH